MVFFLRSLFIQPLLNGYMVYRIWKSRDLGQVWKRALIILYAIETLFFFVAYFAGHRFSIETYAMMQTISGIWVVVQGYLILAILLFDWYYSLAKKFQSRSFFKEKVVRATKLVIFTCFFFVLSFQLCRGYHNFIHPAVKHYTCAFGDRDNDVRARYRLLAATDLHLGYMVNARILEHFVNEINAQQPDIVVICGDLIDYELRPLVAGKMDTILRRIQAPQGKYFIPGNHEYKLDPKLSLQWISERAGMTVLRDSVVLIDSTLYLIGRDDRKLKKKRLSIEELLEKTGPAFPRILFSHQPGDIPDSYRHDIPLTVCGHTHCGQIFPANWLVKWIFPNGYGWKYSGTSASYTTSGLGVTGFPLRIGSRSEMVVFEIVIY